MADDMKPAGRIGAREILLWEVKGASPGEAKARALEMGALADEHDLGEWEAVPIGFGRSWWFDLTLARDADPVFLALVFSGSPDRRY